MEHKRSRRSELLDEELQATGCTPPTPRGNQLQCVLLLRGKLLALCTAWKQISAHNMIERV